MSRKKFSISDFDKYLKPLHLGGKAQTLTVTHIGVLKQPPRQREFVVAGDNPDEVENAHDLVPVLHFREIQKPFRVTQATNRETILKAIGQIDLEHLIGAKVTLATDTMQTFQREFIVIKKIELARVKQDPTPYRTERLGQLRALRLKEKELLTARGVEQTLLMPERVRDMAIEEIEALIAQTESNVMDLSAREDGV